MHILVLLKAVIIPVIVLVAAMAMMVVEELVRSRITDAARAQLPDSIVVVDDKNNIFTRSAAIIYVMKRLGGLWLVAATLLNLVPRALRDFGYAVCASLRKAAFGTTQELCPLVPVQWRARFRN